MGKTPDKRTQRLKAIIAYMEQMDESELHRVNVASYKMIVRRRAEAVDQMAGVWKMGDTVFFVSEANGESTLVKGRLHDIRTKGQVFVVTTEDNAVWRVHPYFCERTYQGAWATFKRLKREGFTDAK